MAFEKLDRDDQNVILQCLTAILKGPFIEEIEFQTRLGFDRSQLARIISNFPRLDNSGDSTATLAINNCLNEVVNGVSIPDSEWQKWFTSSREELAATYRKWSQQEH